MKSRDGFWNKGKSAIAVISVVVVLLVIGLVDTVAVLAHCDTMAGPVIVDAQKALSTKDISQVLKWVKVDDEPEITRAFEKTLAAREASAEARQVADAYFFETLVRVHRAGEGEPYTGLKSSEAIEPGIAMADESLIKGDVQPTISEITESLANRIATLFAAANEASKHKDQDIESGRAYVRAYVEYIHFVESVHALAAESGGHHGSDESPHAH